jgi:hypothetical protein
MGLMSMARISSRTARWARGCVDFFLRTCGMPSTVVCRPFPLVVGTVQGTATGNSGPWLCDVCSLPLRGREGAGTLRLTDRRPRLPTWSEFSVLLYPFRSTGAWRGSRNGRANAKT